MHGLLTPRELARAAAISSSGTITGAIDRLERAGWTTRTPCQVDRRKVFITLTEVPASGSSIAEALHGCSDDELAAAIRVLEALSPPASDA
ncbi:hypothetical protein AD006_30465 (plasmid) [Pseudonocardia sp. EC080610-09]|uniref:MarR family winged helix-turn-helix transcriptional regulator n=1 Tax=unclassified Pseudonocardia TaxID=2619320 RepID=UPI00070589BC|nr:MULTISPECIES: MarR family transcriptional regulator [unclassified Pseudonocardia]ALL79540.1 hypothetical protein AD006_30465 [Pseudonocardia sp. EC080610-09]ALL85507.1 hypothetical protein AD017_30785 [Pseudonocardia sp. EC080619-01]